MLAPSSDAGAEHTSLPLGISLYVIRALLYPTAICEQAIDIIRLLAHIEEIRVHAGNRARAALEWNARVLWAQRNGDSEWTDVRALGEGSEVERVVREVADNVRGQGHLYLAYKGLVARWQALVRIFRAS